MRTKIKNVFMLGLVAAVCGITAIFSWKAPVNTVSAATETNVFEMQEGASIRTADNAGLRFRVKMSEDVKDKVVTGEAELGFVISLTKYFDEVSDGEYIEVTPKIEVSSLVIPSTKIYLGRDEDAGYWWANGVVGNMHEENLVKDYSGVAYLKTTMTTEGETVENYEYASAPQSRSVQLVASRAYFGETSTVWDKIKTVYPKIGTEEMPILIGGDQWNTYDNLVAKVNGGETQEGVYFELTENIMADKKLSANFKGHFVNNGFTVTTYEGIYENVKTDDFAIELLTVNSNKYGQGSISSVAYNETVEAVEATFDVSNFQSFDVAVKPTQNKEYYENLKLNGYKYLTLKIRVPDSCDWMFISEAGVGDYTEFEGNGADSTKSKILLADGVENTKGYYLGNWGLKKGWHEISISIDKLIDNYSESVRAFRLWITRPNQNIVYLGGVYATQNGINIDVNLTLGTITAASGGTISSNVYNPDSNIHSLTFDKTTLTIKVMPKFDKAYYAMLKELGYKYLTIKVRTSTEKSDLYFSSLWLNTKDGTQYYAGSGLALKNGEPVDSDGDHFIGTWGGGVDTWMEISISIDSFINDITAGGYSGFKFYVGWNANTSGIFNLDIGGVYLTKAGTLVSNQA